MIKRKREPNFERLRDTLFFCGEPDRIPLVELGIDREVKEAFLGKPVKSFKDSIEFCKRAGYDYYILRFSYTDDFNVGSFSKQPWGAATEVPSVYGLGKKERHWLREKKSYISSVKDFDKFPWPKYGETPIIAGEPDVAILPAKYAIEDIEKYLPKKMRVIGWTSGIYEYVVWLMGYENFCFALKDNSGLIKKMFEQVGSLLTGLFEYMTKFNIIGALWLADDLAYTNGLLWSPKPMRRLLFPWYVKISSIAKKAGLPLIFHSDGKLWDIMDDLINIGFNALHPIEPKAMDICEVRRKVGHNLCLIGNIDLGYTLTRGTPDEVEAEVKNRIRDLAPGGGYCVGSSNSIPDYVPLKNYNAMIEATFRYGKYPIRL